MIKLDPEDASYFLEKLNSDNKAAWIDLPGACPECGRDRRSHFFASAFGHPCILCPGPRDLTRSSCCAPILEESNAR